MGSTGYPRGMLQRRGFERSIAVLDAFEPAVAREFARTTAVALRGFHADEGWGGGLLNRTGAPLEISCATFSDDIRYSVELSESETPPAARLSRANALLEELGRPMEPGIAIRRLGAMQEGATLRWGAWLGIRHGKRGTAFKIYAEIPAQSNPAVDGLLAEYLVSLPTLSGGRAQPALIGQALDSDRCEIYFELPQRGLSVGDVERLLAHAELKERKEALLELVRSFEFRSGTGNAQALPEAQWGFSYSLLPGGREPVFSLFAFARDLAGGDGSMRRQILAASRGRDWNLGCYPALSEPLTDWYFRSEYHNMISFVVAEAPMVGMQVSLSPPPQEPND